MRSDCVSVMPYHRTVEMCDMHSHGIDSKVIETMGLEEEYKLFIGGKRVPSSDGKKFTAYCAATGEKLAECAEATEADVDAAVKAAQEAFLAWAVKMPAERAVILNKIADAMMPTHPVSP